MRNYYFKFKLGAYIVLPSKFRNRWMYCEILNKNNKNKNKNKNK